MSEWKKQNNGNYDFEILSELINHDKQSSWC